VLLVVDDDDAVCRVTARIPSKPAIGCSPAARPRSFSLRKPPTISDIPACLRYRDDKDAKDVRKRELTCGFRYVTLAIRVRRGLNGNGMTSQARLIARSRVVLCHLSLAVSMLGCHSTPSTQSPGSRREAQDGRLISRALPSATFRIDPALRYLGVDSFALKGIAHVERYFFAETSGGVVRRLLAFQFEDILPGVDEIYRWQIRSPRLIGGETYHSTAFVFSVPSQVLAEPDAEIARAVAFLGRQGLRLEDEQLVARFARVIGDDRRHEFIIFYNEPLAATGHALAEVRAADEDLKPEFVGLRTAITARALESFTVRGPS
jgi:hypothetical protein